ncbi:MAG: hypothetical protein Q7T81_01025 [Pseudolabrys sp.]|nr:hypothetical protein [Pseudolabrys sp.]
MSSRKSINVDEFIREAQRGTSAMRLAVRYGICLSSVRKVAKENGVKLATNKELRRKNGLSGSTRWSPPPR